MALKIGAPPGYGPVAAFSSNTHRGLGVRGDLTHAWAANLNAVYVNAAEFVKAALDYPIAFTRDPLTKEIIPVAVFGLRNRENLFVDASGAWAKHVYVPAYVRRYPFCVAEIPGKDGAAATQMVCVDEAQLVASDRPLFDAAGKGTEHWKPRLSLIETIEAARQQTRVLCKRLEALKLLVDFDAVAMPRGRPQMRLSGMLRVDEAKLEAVPASTMRTLMQKGELRAIYAHLVSLENFGRLMDLAVERR